MSLPGKAVLLAAGYGKRMEELTESVPKPLVPFQGLPLLYYTLHFLEKLGIKQVYANLFYQPEPLVNEFDRIARRTDFRFFTTQEDFLYGSAGGLRNLIQNFPELDEYLLINCDILFRHTTDALADLQSTVTPAGTHGTLLLVPNDGNQTGLQLNEGRVQFQGGGGLQYIGLSTWQSGHLDYIPQTLPFELRPVWENMAAESAIAGRLCPFDYYSVGTKAEWQLLNNEYEKSAPLVELVQATKEFANRYGLPGGGKSG